MKLSNLEESIEEELREMQDNILTAELLKAINRDDLLRDRPRNYAKIIMGIVQSWIMSELNQWVSRCGGLQNQLNKLRNRTNQRGR